MSQQHPLLVLTDIPANAKIIQESLGAEHLLDSPGPGVDVLALIKDSKPDLILLDMECRAYDARTLFERLKEHPAILDIPCIALCPDIPSADLALRLGATDCAIKPLSAPILQNRVKQCLHLARCKEVLRHFALVDELTGIANRRRFEEFLNMEWRRNFRNQTPLTVILMDLDHFSSYTDHYGMNASDACLQRVASVLSQLMQRPGDLIARYGRGGFACVLPETDTVGAVSVAERFRAEVFALAIPHEALGEGSILTASLGVATGVPLSGAEPEDLLTLAERHLFEAKRAGRNRLVFG